MFRGRLVQTWSSLQLCVLLNKPVNTDRNYLCSTKHFNDRLNDTEPNSALKTAHFNTLRHSDLPHTDRISLTGLMFRWVAALLLYQLLITIQIFSWVSTAVVFVQTLRGAAVIMHVRDSTRAFSWNCPPTHVVFLKYFFLPCSQETQYVNESDAQTIIQLSESEAHGEMWWH